MNVTETSSGGRVSIKTKTVGASPGHLFPAIHIAPCVTLWNPYNVELTVPASKFRVKFYQGAPVRLHLRIGTEDLEPVSMQDCMTGRVESHAAGSGINRGLYLQINEDTVLKPGESRIFGASSVNDGFYSTTLKLNSGFKEQAGFTFTRMIMEKASNGSMSKFTAKEYPVGTSFSLRKIDYHADASGKFVTDTSKAVRGTYFLLQVDGKFASEQEALYTEAQLPGDIVDQIFPELDSPITATLQSLHANGATPALVSTVALRGGSQVPGWSANANLNTKGMLQANPLANWSRLGSESYSSDFGGNASSVSGTGANHPSHAPYIYYVEEAQGWNAGYPIPQYELTTNEAFMVTGFEKADGIKRAIMAEVPLRPLQSLAELQHFDATMHKPVPPFQMNIIGNSSAHPLFEPDEINAGHAFANNLGHMSNDDSYLTNHVLFDDWFVSSIAPRLNPFSSSIAEDSEAVYKQFLEGADDLPNRFYKASLSALEGSIDEEVDRAHSTTEEEKAGYGYENVASRLEVKGMFNINSTSQKAWTALLKHGRDARVPYMTSTGGVSLDAGTGMNVAFPRSSVAGAANGSSTEEIVNGYLSFSDEQIDELARLIVTEVKERGPFLSLSEFVNRQLVNDQSADSRALAGVIQYALDRLAESSSSTQNPYRELQALGTDVDPSIVPGAHEYAFMEAGKGSSMFGMPGWVRQADVLMPLAPIMSARDDSFTIRAYGDVRDPRDDSKVLAKAWCEVLVQRVADFVDPQDAATTRLPELDSDVNKLLGRKYKVVSFRWLDPSEVEM